MMMTLLTVFAVQAKQTELLGTGQIPSVQCAGKMPRKPKSGGANSQNSNSGGARPGPKTVRY
jgi:hypothetical protein